MLPHLSARNNAIGGYRASWHLRVSLSAVVKQYFVSQASMAMSLRDHQTMTLLCLKSCFVVADFMFSALRRGGM